MDRTIESTFAKCTLVLRTLDRSDDLLCCTHNATLRETSVTITTVGACMTSQPPPLRYARYSVSKNVVAICPEMLGASAPATLPRPAWPRQSQKEPHGDENGTCVP